MAISSAAGISVVAPKEVKAPEKKVAQPEDDKKSDKPSSLSAGLAESAKENKETKGPDRAESNSGKPKADVGASVDVEA